MFIDQSQNPHNLAHLWATEELFRSWRSSDSGFNLITVNISSLRDFVPTDFGSSRAFHYEITVCVTGQVFILPGSG